MGANVTLGAGGTIAWKCDDKVKTTIVGAGNKTNVKATKNNQKVGNNTTVKIVNVESSTGVNWDGKVGNNNYTSTLTVGSETINKKTGDKYAKIENKTTVVGGPDTKVANETEVGVWGKVLAWFGISLEVNTSDKKVNK